MKFKKASLSDLEILVSTRVNVLRSANQLDLSVDMKEVEKSSRLYYQEALASDNHTAFLVYNADDNVIGAGAVSYYQVMPTYHNPSGKKAYIMNMYVAPEHRRKGIATKLLDLLIADSKERGIDHITLEATQMGRKLYENYGFCQMQDEMEYTMISED
ncbi:Acetyltransferase (GNAT) family protein [Streptococcus gallolyticus]|uniref:Acetyltransferase (GNAT) family protein n=1 Tax=Streptococcus gallolyticus TaxID=315405 RepID=A0A1I7HBX2_9STRE|nr:GNAT family N-acetyltransferase [Streptococcus gallolyticus]SFC27083.1 Acetyltransferase (GNAT) family protein [Streptococcus gallolyticus]SFU58218.1 Acetyltransferase (GNAT) family protein [Streptococcus gallolyticus]